MKHLSFLFLSLFILTACDKDDDVDNHNDNNNNNSQTHYKQAVGESANELLSDAKYKTLIVELQYMKGFRPTETALDNLKIFLNNTVNKSTVKLVEKEVASGGKSSYSVDDVRAFEDGNRSKFTRNDTITAYFLFTDAPYSGNSQNSTTLGIAYRNTSMVIFEKTIRDHTDDPITEPSSEKVESAVINHEFGHILGLVDIGTPMQTNHKDPEHGSHCNVDDCLMYWAVETGNIFDNLLGSPIPELDALCRQDLKSNGGK